MNEARLETANTPLVVVSTRASTIRDQTIHYRVLCDLAQLKVARLLKVDHEIRRSLRGSQLVHTSNMPWST